MILILGSKGMLGTQLLKVFGQEAIGWDRSDCDVTDFTALKSKIVGLHPTVIINSAAFNDVDSAEINQEQCLKLNSEVPGFLASLCKELDIPLVHFSSNYVFDGQKEEYFETDEPNPLSIYGASKYAGEELIKKQTKKFYIIRTAVIFGPKGQSASSKKSFIDTMLGIAAETDTIKTVKDEVNSLTYAPDLAEAVKQILDQRPPFGIYHIANSGSASWYSFAREIFKIKNMAVNLVPVSSEDFRRLAQRPRQAVLSSNKIDKLRPWQEALSEYLNQEV